MRQICLTERETEVFRLLCKGYSDKDTARELGITPKTASVHRSHLYQKLGAHSIRDILALAPETEIHVMSNGHGGDRRSIESRLMRIEEMLGQLVGREAAL